jgi:hypothetical protein
MLNIMRGNYLVLTICLSVALSGAELYLLNDGDYKEFFKYDSSLEYIGVVLDIIAILACLSDKRLIVVIPVILYDIVFSRNIVGLLLAVIVYVFLTYQISSDGQSIPFKETGIDPLCLDQIDPSVHSYINEIKDILLGQLKKDNPYDMSLDTLTLLGEVLLGIERHATFKERLGLT